MKRDCARPAVRLRSLRVRGWQACMQGAARCLEFFLGLCGRVCRGGHGRRHCRLVRGGGAVPASAGVEDSAHGDHPERTRTRIGAKLAGFICDNFLSTSQVLDKLEQFDAAGRHRRTGWPSPPTASNSAEWGVAASALRLRRPSTTSACAPSWAARLRLGWRRVDLSRLTGQALEALTEGGRHQALLDDVLQQVASACSRARSCRSTSPRPSRARSRTLRYVGLDQVAARLATRKIVAAVAQHHRRAGGRSQSHPMRKRFDHFVDARVRGAPEASTRAFQAARRADPRRAASRTRRWATTCTGCGASCWAGCTTDLQPPRLVHPRSASQRWRRHAGRSGCRRTSSIRRWINEQIEAAAAPLAIERYREDIRRYIEERVGAVERAGDDGWSWSATSGRDLQFIRINGTLVGGLVGLADPHGHAAAAARLNRGRRPAHGRRAASARRLTTS
jgi:uncharacterized membrane-anchored protein YjiN (DUF445 family)